MLKIYLQQNEKKTTQSSSCKCADSIIFLSCRTGKNKSDLYEV